MSNLRKWSQTATGNASVAGGSNTINFAEGQSPGSVNNSARELMAQVRGVYTPSNWGWVEFSATASVASQTTFKITGNQTTDYSTGRRVRLKSGSSTRYGSIVSSSYTTETTVTLTVDSGSLSASHSLAAVSVLDGNNVQSYYAVRNAANTFSANQTISSTTGDVALVISGAAGNNRYIPFQTNSSFRFAIGLNTVAESGSGAGSNLSISRYDDSGTFVASTFGISRSTGLTTLESLSVNGNAAVISASGVLGYGTGAGGAVTQLTSRTTGVTLNKPTGQITLFTAAGTTSWTSFVVTNSLVTLNDTIVVTQQQVIGANLYIFTTQARSGAFQLSFASTSGTASDTPIFNFAIIRSVNA